MRRSRAGGDETGGGVIPTLEMLWEDHGHRLRQVALGLLDGDEEAADAACFAVMVRVGEWLELRRSPVAFGQEWRWLRRLCVGVCDEIAAEGVDPSWVVEGRLPESLPRRLRESVRFRAARYALERAEEDAAASGPIARARRRDRRRWREQRDRFLGFPVVVLLPRVLRRVWESAERAGRSAWRRVEGVGATALPSGQRAAGLLSVGSGVPEAAAALGAALAMGIAAPTPPGEPAEPVERPERVAVVSETPRSAEARSEAGPVGGVEGRVAPPPADPTPPVTEPEPEEPEGGDSGSSSELAVPESPVEARAEADPEDTASGPVQDTPNNHGTNYYVDAGVNASADADGDGEDDATVQSPRTGWGCGPPEERPPASAVLCPALEESDLPHEEYEEG